MKAAKIAKETYQNGRTVRKTAFWCGGISAGRTAESNENNIFTYKERKKCAKKLTAIFQWLQ
ncbi:MAG: hypothetical protein RR139_02535 [Lachnospiraceae bacterium]